MASGKAFIVTVTIVAVFTLIASTSFLGKDKVFAQSNLFGNNNGGLVGNMFKNFGNMVGNLGISNNSPNNSPSVSSDPFTGLFGNTPNITPSDKSRVLDSLFGIPSSIPSNTNNQGGERNGHNFVDKPCHPGSCLGTPGYYTIQGHHHCFDGTRDCIQTSHFKGGHY